NTLSIVSAVLAMRFLIKAACYKKIVCWYFKPNITRDL
ncbi:MAG: hypothetical protein ACI9QV_001243, partial [Methylophagaceae bacterium]